MPPMMLRSFPASPWEGLDVPSAMLLGIQRDPGPPVVFGPHRFERLRIVIVDREPPPGDDGDDFDGAAPDEMEILPQIPLQRRGPLPAARPVHGEILRGEDGALYERFGQRIRPLRALASGPRGEVLEVAAAPVAQPEDRAPRTEERKPKTEEPVAPPAEAAPPRALFADPGHWRVVRFGDFRNVLSPQLEQPVRIRDTHWLPCHAQVFECAPPPSREAFAIGALGDAELADEILPLTPPLVHTLQLAAVLPPPTRGTVRFLHLRLAHDPTETPETATTTPPAAPAVAQAPASITTATPVAPLAPALKTEIPPVYSHSGAFARSRDEVMFAIVAEHGFWSRLQRRLFTPTVATRDLHQWQVMLSGRSADEQLWAVPPPRGWAHDESVRAWAMRTLELAGYDPCALLREWEIYWRRKNY